MGSGFHCLRSSSSLSYIPTNHSNQRLGVISQYFMVSWSQYFMDTSQYKDMDIKMDMDMDMDIDMDMDMVLWSQYFMDTSQYMDMDMDMVTSQYFMVSWFYATVRCRLLHYTMQSGCQISAYVHYARTPVLQLKQRTDDFHGQNHTRIVQGSSFPFALSWSPECKTKNFECVSVKGVAGSRGSSTLHCSVASLRNNKMVFIATMVCLSRYCKCYIYAKNDAFPCL